MDKQQIEDIYNRTFAGLTLFYRDMTLDNSLTAKYTVGQILNERGFTDMSSVAAWALTPKTLSA